MKKKTKIIKFINAAGDGTVCRTIKAQYWKTSTANFLHNDGLGATGVVEIYTTEDE